MRALVTGFDPFGGENVNASLEAVRRLPARIGALEVITAELPTSYARALAVLEQAIMEARPEIVLCVGQVSERAALCVERVAGGPAAYLATLPVRAAVAALRAAELPAEVSMSAGTFVCNHVFYGLMHLAATGGHAFRGGFLHVPCLPRQVAREKNTPSMALDDIVRGIVIVLEVAGET